MLCYEYNIYGASISSSSSDGISYRKKQMKTVSVSRARQTLGGNTIGSVCSATEAYI